MKTKLHDVYQKFEFLQIESQLQIDELRDLKMSCNYEQLENDNGVVQCTDKASVCKDNFHTSVKHTIPKTFISHWEEIVNKKKQK